MSSTPIQYPTLPHLHEALYNTSSIPSYLDEKFLGFIEKAREWLRREDHDSDDAKQERLALLRSVLSLECKDVYSLPMFTMEFCQHIIEEVKFLEEEIRKLGVKYTRPNSMNSYGLVLEEVGMKPWWDVFVNEYFSVLGAIMSPNEPRLDDHHTFIVEYQASGKEWDKKLDLHVDDSELTLNLCLGEEGFEGGNLFIAGHIERPHTYQDYSEYEHVIGKAIIHDGKQMHGALDLTKGRRFNLIMWGRSSKFREENRHIVKPMQHEHHHEHGEDCGCEGHEGHEGHEQQHVHDDNCGCEGHEHHHEHTESGSNNE